MKRRILCGLLLLPALLVAQPKLRNAKLENRTGALDAQLKAILSSQVDAAWAGYSVPMVAGEHRSCCWYSDNGSSYAGCMLEEGEVPRGTVAQPSPIHLESAKELHVLLRVENKQVTRIRSYSSDCELDAGGTTVYWLAAVRPADSVHLLESYLKDTSGDTARQRDRVRGGALSAISLHADPSAEALLERLAPTERQAVHGLANRPEALPFLLNMAKNDPSPRTRGEVLGMLADRAGIKAIPAIQDAINRETDKEGLRPAVRALARLPKEEGVPLLIQVAKTHKNPEARKEAMQALSRSKDPRATAFFEEVLNK